MESDTLEDIIIITDGLQPVLRTAGDFIRDKITDQIEDKLTGPILSIPRKAVNLGPTVASYLGQQPGDEPYDTLRDWSQEFEENPFRVHTITDDNQGPVRVDRDFGQPEPPSPDVFRDGEKDP